MKRTSSSVLGLAALVAAAGLLAGCGDTSEPTTAKTTTTASPTPTLTPAASSSATPTPAPKPLPRCSSVWVADKRLPGGYHGCSPAGAWKASDRYYCESGQVLVTFQNHFYAARTGRIFHDDDVRHDATFHHKLDTCRG